MGFLVKSRNLLFVNPATAGKVIPPFQSGEALTEWINYGGSKIWPAPQGWDGPDKWPGPPDAILDGSPYEAEILKTGADEVQLRLTSPADPLRTGLCFQKTLTLKQNEPMLHLSYRMENCSKRTVRWSIWEVNQMDCRGVNNGFNPDISVYAPVNPKSRFFRGYQVLFGLANNPQWRTEKGLFSGNYRNLVSKTGLDSSGGWLAFEDRLNKTAMITRFTHFPGQAYPNGDSIEFWMQGKGDIYAPKLVHFEQEEGKDALYLLETEVLSPLKTLRPGESYTFATEWEALEGPLPERIIPQR